MANEVKPPTPTTPQRGASRSVTAISLFVGGSAALLASDLALKSWALQNLKNAEMRPLVPHVLALAWTENHGAVFGVLQNKQWVFVIASMIAVCVIGWIFFASRAIDRALHLALALIFAGALGNLYDRVQHGYVRDMLYLFPGVKFPGGFKWPGTSGDIYPWIFNLADVFLLIGILIVLVRSYRQSHRQAAAPSGATQRGR